MIFRCSAYAAKASVALHPRTQKIGSRTFAKLQNPHKNLPIHKGRVTAPTVARDFEEETSHVAFCQSASER